jgi:four helix bundle protein
MITSAKDLDVYKLTFSTTLEIYRITESFPKSELFGLVAQMRRAAISINSNLIEGSARGSYPEYRKFAKVALGSAEELKYQLELSNSLEFIKDNDFVNIFENLERICKMLMKLIVSLEIKIRTTDNG